MIYIFIWHVKGVQTVEGIDTNVNRVRIVVEILGRLNFGFRGARKSESWHSDNIYLVGDDEAWWYRDGHDDRTRIHTHMHFLYRREACHEHFVRFRIDPVLLYESIFYDGVVCEPSTTVGNFIIVMSHCFFCVSAKTYSTFFLFFFSFHLRLTWNSPPKS